MDVRPDFKTEYRAKPEREPASIWYPETVAIAVIVALFWIALAVRIVLYALN